MRRLSFSEIKNSKKALFVVCKFSYEMMLSLIGRTLPVFFVVCFMSSLAQADTVGLLLSADSAEFSYTTGGEYSNPVDWGMTAYYNSRKEKNERRTTDSMVSFDMETALEGDSSSRLVFALGGSAYLLSLDRIKRTSGKPKTETNAGIAIGGKLGVLLTTSVPTLLYVGGYVSPDIVNTGRVQVLRRWMGMLEVMLSPAAILQIGYHNYSADFDKRFEHLSKTTKTFEDRVVAGIKLRF